MQSDFWHQRWQRNEIGFHQEEVNLHLREYWPQVGAPDAGTVFVPLCGKSNDMLWLREGGHPVIGVELSPLAVEAFFRDNGLEATRQPGERYECWTAGESTLLCGDYFALKPEDVAGVAAVYDRASLIALPPDMRTRYANQLIELFKGRVPVLLVTLEYPEEQMQGPPFCVHEDEVRRLYGAHYDISCLVEHDVLADNPHLRGKGIDFLTEKAYLLRPAS